MTNCNLKKEDCWKNELVSKKIHTHTDVFETSLLPFVAKWFFYNITNSPCMIPGRKMPNCPLSCMKNAKLSWRMPAVLHEECWTVPTNTRVFETYLLRFVAIWFIYNIKTVLAYNIKINMPNCLENAKLSWLPTVLTNAELFWRMPSCLDCQPSWSMLTIFKK